MPLSPNPASSIIDISSDVSPTKAVISVHSSPAQRGSSLMSGASRLRTITDRSVFLGSPILANRPFSRSPQLGSPSPPYRFRSPLLGSPSAARSQSRDVEHELTLLREQCATLNTVNGELRGRVKALKYILFLCYIKLADEIYSAAYEHLVARLSEKIDLTRSDVKTLTKTMSAHSAGSVTSPHKRGRSREVKDVGPSSKRPKIVPIRAIRNPAKRPLGKVS